MLGPNIIVSEMQIIISVMNEINNGWSNIWEIMLIKKIL